MGIRGRGAGRSDQNQVVEEGNLGSCFVNTETVAATVQLQGLLVAAGNWRSLQCLERSLACSSMIRSRVPDESDKLKIQTSI